MSLTLKGLQKFVTEFSPSALERKAAMVKAANTTLSYYEMKQFVEDALGFGVFSIAKPGYTTIAVSTGPGSVRGGCSFKSTASYADVEKMYVKYDIDATTLREAVGSLIGHIVWQAQLYNQSQREMKES